MPLVIDTRRRGAIVAARRGLEFRRWLALLVVLSGLLLGVVAACARLQKGSRDVVLVLAEVVLVATRA